MSCDVCVPYKKVHMRSAFFWVEGEELHLVPLHKDGFLADETPIEPATRPSCATARFCASAN